MFENVISILSWAAIIWLPLLALSVLTMWYIRLLGYRTTKLLGLIGVPVHEAGHWVMAKLCGHKILDVTLFKPSIDGSLGSVSHQYNVTWYSPFANLLIALAPLATGFGAFLLATDLVRPDMFMLLKMLPESIWSLSDIGSVLAALWRQLISTGGFWQTAGWLLVSLSLLLFCVPSKADFMGCRAGVIALLLMSSLALFAFPEGMSELMVAVQPFAVLIGSLLWSALLVTTLLFLVLTGIKRMVITPRP